MARPASPLRKAWRSRTTDVVFAPAKAVSKAWPQMGMPREDGLLAVIWMVLMSMGPPPSLPGAPGLSGPWCAERVGRSKVSLPLCNEQTILWAFLEDFLPPAFGRLLSTVIRPARAAPRRTCAACPDPRR